MWLATSLLLYVANKEPVLDTVDQLIRRFLREVANEEDVFYNEASLQHELALFLRAAMPPQWRLHLERPASWFKAKATKLAKKEIDLVVSDATSQQLIAIELKCPRSGRHPETMFDVCKDIQFLEELVSCGFAGGVFALHVHDPLFYEHGSRAGIYSFFRGDASISGVIAKPTGSPAPPVVVRGSYRPAWEVGSGTNRYWVQPISSVR